MQRRVALVVALAVAALLALVLLAPSGAQISQAIFNETEVKRTVGDESDTWRTRVYTRSGKFAGTGVIACVPTSQFDSIQQCNGTYLLPRGRVAVAGLVSSRTGFNLVIVGGTDTYLGAKGNMVATQQSSVPRKSSLTFFFK